ncbi:hypothetical protein [Longimicrobium terrae]|uniref:NERD domain-containing protein n=1 Tax=Longimicrobium terrae TaxID=1639882 RepID=A0A841H1C8_9BACT|nr:hypothetical protein [Longimicrobium terrae]MBB4637518.1 hypothetical protein [Longimicrobium terrae]MBB6071915.1 hypothetical protein [Longimicrobium terrae]NNC30462.1 hypothetical protein [Longimicrobium terrae]
MVNLIGQLPEGFWLHDPATLVRVAGTHQATKADVATCIEALQRALERGRSGQAAGWLALGFVLQPERFGKRLRRDGMLRASKYEFVGSTISQTVEAVLACHTALGLSEQVRTYLESVLALADVAKGVRKSRLRLVRLLRNGPPSLIKSLAVSIDAVFKDVRPADLGAPTNTSAHHTAEQLAEGFSLLCHMYSENVGFARESFGRVDVEGVVAGKYLDWFADGAMIRRFTEWEVLVDWGTHVCSRAGDGNAYDLTPVDARNEMALRLGYLQSSTAAAREALAAPAQDAFKLTEFAERTYRAMVRGGAFKVLQDPVRRVTMHVPSAAEFWAIFTEENLFGEEGAHLSSAMQAYLIPADQLTEFKIRGVAVWDIMKVQRVFNVMRHWMNRYMEDFLPKDPWTAAQSSVPVYSHEHLRELLGKVMDPANAEGVLRLLTWPGDTVFDVQYQPMITDGTFVMAPLNILGMSDLIRNSLQHSRTRFHGGAQDDPAERMLASVFPLAGHAAKASVKYKHGGEEGEVDVLAVVDGRLFAFECKNSLVPTGPFELRTTLDHLAHAEEQLDRFRRLSADPEFLKSLATKTGLDCTNPSEIHTCAVTTNRMLSGAFYGAHPVRSLFELGNFILGGEIVLRGRPRRQVSGTRATGEELSDNLRYDPARAPVFAAMVPYALRYEFGESRVDVHSFGIDDALLATELGEIPHPEE